MRMRWIILALVVLWLAPVATSAQDAPQPVQNALFNLSSVVNQNLTINDMQRWTFEQQQFSDTSLGCPQPGQTYNQVLTLGYRIILTYNGVDYDYRVTSDGRFTTLCSSAPSTVAGAVCPPVEAGWMPARLQVNGQGRVVPGNIPNNVRQQPGQSAQKIGEIPAGAVFAVLSGPSCTVLDKLVWWQVNFNGLIGWTPEGQAPDYWLEPLDAAGNPIAAPDAGIGFLELDAQSAVGLQEVLAPGVVLNYAVDPSGELLVLAVADAAAGQTNLRLRDLRTGAEQPFAARTGVTDAPLAFGLDTSTRISYLAAITETNTVTVWRVGPDRQLAPATSFAGAQTATALAFNDGGLLAIGYADGSLSLYDLRTVTPVQASLAGNGQAIRSLMFAGEVILATDVSGALRVFGAPSTAG